MLREKVEQNLFSAHIHPSRSASVRKSIVYILHSPHGRMLFLMENKRFENSRYAHWLFYVSEKYTTVLFCSLLYRLKLPCISKGWSRTNNTRVSNTYRSNCLLRFRRISLIMDTNGCLYCNLALLL